MMKFNCPECNTELSAKRAVCDCGWKKPIKKFEDQKIIFICEHKEFSHPCGKKNVDRYGDKFLCRDHGDEWILKNLPDSISAKAILDARQHVEYAKAAGMKNLEWFKDCAATHNKERPDNIFDFEVARLARNA